MRHKLDKLVEDVLQAAHEVEGFLEEQNFELFTLNRQLQVAIERELEIVGEALYRIRQLSPEVFTQIPDGEKIIGMRNILVHGYDMLDSKLSGMPPPINFLNS